MALINDNSTLRNDISVSIQILAMSVEKQLLCELSEQRVDCKGSN